MYGTIIMGQTLQLFNQQKYEYPIPEGHEVVKKEGYVIIKPKN